MSLNTFFTFSNVIDGKLEPTQAVRYGINPANKEQLWSAPKSALADVDAAVSVARRVAPTWAAVPWADRQTCISNFAEALAAHSEQFSRILTSEQGKPLAVARAEVSQAVHMLRGISSLHLRDYVVEETKEHRLLTRYIPIGVCVGIVPWNFPIVLSIFKLGPAVAAGNTFILKPSPFTPYSGLKLVELAQNFFPPGVVQALGGGDELGPWLTEHPGVDKVSFTGSTTTGTKVLQSCSTTLKRVTLELGGNDPAVVCPDVDIRETATKVCVAIKRVYIHSSIYDAFVEELKKHVQTLNVGDGMKETSDLGPVQNEMQFNKLRSLIADMREDGLKFITGDKDETFKNDKGFFVNPVIVDNPPDDARIVTEEPFGPVFPVLKWETEKDVIDRANDSEMALGASVWSRDHAQASRIARQLEAGNVWINTHMELRPDAAFGGLKQSGIGCELGLEGLRAYCNVQTLYQDAI